MIVKRKLWGIWKPTLNDFIRWARLESMQWYPDYWWKVAASSEHDSTETK